MQEELRKALYFQNLREKLKYVTFDPAGGEAYLFEELFYPLSIDEGMIAFQSFAEQMEKARSSAANTPANVSIKRAEEKKEAEKQIQDSKEKISELLRLRLNATAQQQSRVKTTKVSTVSASAKKEEGVSDGSETKRVSKEDIISTTELLKERIAEKLERNKSTSASLSSDMANADPAQSEELNFLLEEPDFDPGSLIIDRYPERSRIIAYASAGHGKSTLLRRIALYYCPSLKDDKAAKDRDEKIRNFYSLTEPGQLIPCLILLRHITDGNFSVTRAIEKSVRTVFMREEAGQDQSSETDIQQWIDSVRDDLLLLIDGLDELSDSVRFDFLAALDDYLVEHPKTRIIITSRISGLTDDNIQNILKKMQFRGRSILPITKNDVKKYAVTWINATQEPEKREAYLSSLNQVLTQKKYKRYRELIRTPLELLMLLKQITRETLSSNRTEMFHDNLWGYITNHVKRSSLKKMVFEDEMTVLGFIAYQMQLKDSLFMTLSELDDLSSKLSHLSFQTDVLGDGTTEDYRKLLDSLAANVGIVEKDDHQDDIVYTFPIRTYQEYLTAYACCHLRLDTGWSKPNPLEIIKDHFGDSRWLNIINYVLSILEYDDEINEFNSIIDALDSSSSDIEQIRSVVEADLSINFDCATMLVKEVFKGQVITQTQRELLFSCMSAKYPSSYVSALNSLYQGEQNQDYRSFAVNYLEANALSTLLFELSNGRSGTDKALSLIRSGKEKQIVLGCEMISLLARTFLDEVFDVSDEYADAKKYKKIIKEEFKVTDDLLAALKDAARSGIGVFGITALTNIWLSRIENSQKAARLLDCDMASRVITELNKNIPVIQDLCFMGSAAFESPEYLRIKELVYTLGSIPFNAETQRLRRHGDGNIYVASLMQAMYEETIAKYGSDQVALAFACFFYCWDTDTFMNEWVWDICRGQPSAMVRKDAYTDRENNHFILANSVMGKISDKYRAEHIKDLNEPKTTAITLFKKGDILGAAKFCVKTMGKEPTSNKNNLAFLIRYGHLSSEALGSDVEFTVPALLEEGVRNNDLYSVINMALFEFELGNVSQAAELFDRVPLEGWTDVANGFWYPDLWQARKDPEGALICVLAHKYADCEFEDYDEMLKAAQARYGDNAEGIIHS